MSFIISLIPQNSYSALAIKPGLWNVEMKITQNGKEFDPQAQMKAALAKMKPDQRKKMESMMAQMSGLGGKAGSGMMGASEKGFQVCYTAEMLKSENVLHHQSEKNCETRFPVKTSEKLIVEFNCKNQTSGNAEWKVLDSTHYEGKMSIKRNQSPDSTLIYKGTFVSTDCGQIKPKN